jgi:hypothetical protein
MRSVTRSTLPTSCCSLPRVPGGGGEKKSEGNGPPHRGTPPPPSPARD